MSKQSELSIQIQLKVTSKKVAEEFYLGKLGMRKVDNDKNDGDQLWTGFETPQFISLIQARQTEVRCTQILTDDCVQEYHRLKKNGVFFSSAPGYTAIGLQAEFNDPFGNRFILTEERNYKL